MIMWVFIRINKELICEVVKVYSIAHWHLSGLLNNKLVSFIPAKIRP